MEELPNYFDVIVVGTGMPECIIAAAAARVGKKVLHLDRNGYYGGDWASFSFDKFMEWIAATETDQEEIEAQNNTRSLLHSFLDEDENLVLCPLKSKSISHLTIKSYINDSPELPPPSVHECQVSGNSDDQGFESSIAEISTEHSASEVSSIVLNSEGNSNEEYEATSNSTGENVSDSPPAASSIADNVLIQEQHQIIQQEWTISSFIENRRKFNIDLSPKLMFSRGSLVELLISSNIARYAEFQCVNRVLTYINGHIEQVPCSRADVFSTKNVTVVEKRMLMKFLTFCMKFEEQEDEYKGFENLPFIEFLKSKKLTPNVEHYIIHAIAMVDDSCSTLQGLQATQKFLRSLGRYGKSPFLCTCYGSAELPQCFCRLCAVYEGMYYLKRTVEAVILKNHVCGIVSAGQRINCQWLVMESGYTASEFLPSELPQSLSRAILITDASLYPSEKKENILLRLPSGCGIKNPVTVLEFSSKTYVCPEDLFLVYLVCSSACSTAEEDLKPAVELLFNCYNTSTVSSQPSDRNVEHKPNILWCLYYNQLDTSAANLNAHVPEGLFITSSSDVELDYEHTVKEAREIFEMMCPGEEFLPRAPDPEDILIEKHNNPGDDGDGGKIENDVNKSDDNSFFEESNAMKTESKNSFSQRTNNDTDEDSHLCEIGTHDETLK